MNSELIHYLQQRRPTQCLCQAGATDTCCCLLSALDPRTRAKVIAERYHLPPDVVAERYHLPLVVGPVDQGPALTHNDDQEETT